jgi:hypothetical protein
MAQFSINLLEKLENSKKIGKIGKIGKAPAIREQE